jgi:hypothetical protein
VLVSRVGTLELEFLSATVDACPTRCGMRAFVQLLGSFDDAAANNPFIAPPKSLTYISSQKKDHIRTSQHVDKALAYTV